MQKLCRQWKGEWSGKPLVLQSWQLEFTRNLFGWRRKSDKSRRYRSGYVSVAKKNGKSTWFAGLASYLLMADGEPGAEIYSAAADRPQAALVFNDAKSMIEQSPPLRRRVEIYKQNIYYPAAHSSYTVMSSDAPRKHGINAHGIIFDELHAQRVRTLYDTLKGAGASRRQPLFLMITTAGNDRKTICYEVHERARRVLKDPELDPSFLPMIFETDKDADWKDEKVWALANPSLDYTVKRDFLRSELAEAIESPAKQNAFRQLHLNQWTQQSVRWIDIDVWNQNGDFVDVSLLRKETCFAGLDLSSSQDLTALVLLFPPTAKHSKWVVLPFFWLPEEGIPRRVLKDGLPFDAWAREGWITLTKGNTVDQSFIRAKIQELGKLYNIQEIGYDRWGATKISTELIDDGFEITQFGQGFKDMSPASKEFERMLLRRELAHGNNPVLRWMAGNVAVRRDPADNMKPDKAESGDRIDGIVSLIMAIGRATAESEGGPISIWSVK